MSLHRTCCCTPSGITCAEWCACLPATKTIQSLDINWRFEERRAGKVIYEIEYTIHLADVELAYATDGQCCWLENIGGEGNGTITVDWVDRFYVWTPSSLDVNGCQHTCHGNTYLCIENTCDSNGPQLLGPNEVRIRCDDPCNPRYCPTVLEPPNHFTMLELDANVMLDYKARGKLPTYDIYPIVCDSSVDATFSASAPIQATFLAPLECLDSSTFNTHALRTFRKLGWFGGGAVDAPATGCSGEPALGWVCKGSGTPYQTQPWYGNTVLEGCPVDDYNIDCHLCYDNSTPPVETFRCPCPNIPPNQTVTKETCTHSVVIV